MTILCPLVAYCLFSRNKLTSAGNQTEALLIWDTVLHCFPPQHKIYLFLLFEIQRVHKTSFAALLIVLDSSNKYHGRRKRNWCSWRGRQLTGGNCSENKPWYLMPRHLNFHPRIGVLLPGMKFCLLKIQFLIIASKRSECRLPLRVAGQNKDRMSEVTHLLSALYLNIIHRKFKYSYLICSVCTMPSLCPSNRAASRSLSRRTHSSSWQ